MTAQPPEGHREWCDACHTYVAAGTTVTLPGDSPYRVCTTCRMQGRWAFAHLHLERTMATMNDPRQPWEVRAEAMALLMEVERYITRMLDRAEPALAEAMAADPRYRHLVRRVPAHREIDVRRLEADRRRGVPAARRLYDELRWRGWRTEAIRERRPGLEVSRRPFG